MSRVSTIKHKDNFWRWNSPPPKCPLRCRSISAVSTTQSRFLSESFSSTYPPGERKSCSSSSEVKNIPQNSKVCLQVSRTEKCYRRDHMSSETGNVKYVSVNRKNRGKNVHIMLWRHALPFFLIFLIDYIGSAQFWYEHQREKMGRALKKQSF